jgi:hypothetical protein
MIFGAFKSKMGEVSGSTMPSFDIPTPTGADMLSNATATPGQTTVVQIENVNIERTAGESENDYLNRMMKTLADQINRSQNQTGV